MPPRIASTRPVQTAVQALFQQATDSWKNVSLNKFSPVERSVFDAMVYRGIVELRHQHLYRLSGRNQGLRVTFVSTGADQGRHLLCREIETIWDVWKDTLQSWFKLHPQPDDSPFRIRFEPIKWRLTTIGLAKKLSLPQANAVASTTKDLISDGEGNEGECRVIQSSFIPSKTLRRMNFQRTVDEILLSSTANIVLRAAASTPNEFGRNQASVLLDKVNQADLVTNQISMSSSGGQHSVSGDKSASNAEQPSKIMENPRDRYMYDLAMAGKPWGDILRAMNGRAKREIEWMPMESVPGVRSAVNRYAARHGLPRPLKRQVGRKRGD